MVTKKANPATKKNIISKSSIIKLTIDAILHFGY